MPISDPDKRAHSMFRNKLARMLLSPPQTPGRPITAVEYDGDDLLVTQDNNDNTIGTVTWRLSVTREDKRSTS